MQVSPLATRSDIDIAKGVVDALKRDTLVDERRIETRVNEGIVYLSGTAEDKIVRVAAESDARTVKGVLDVVNHVAVVPAPARLDQEIADDVRREIQRNVRVKRNQVGVEVVDGVVYLRGNVGTVAQRWIIEDLARWVPGVVDVIDELKVQAA